MNLHGTLRRTIRWFTQRSMFAQRCFRLPSERFFNPERNRLILTETRFRVFRGSSLSDKSAQTSPQELLLRSYAQHLCQIRLVGDSRVRWIQNVLAGGLLVPLTLWWIACYLLGRIMRARPERMNSVAFVYLPYVRGLVERLRPAGSTVFLTRRSVELSLFDLRFALSLFLAFPRCWLDFTFLLKALLAIGYYSFVIRRYQPSEILDCHEHSASVSVQTAYCRARGVKHINFMHGDRALVAEYAFATFDEFYVWGEYYRDLFTSLSCPHDQFTIVGNPLHQSLFCELAMRPASMNLRFCLLVFYETLMTPRSPFLQLLTRLLEEVPQQWHVVIRCRADRSHEQYNGEEFAKALNHMLAERGRPLVDLESERERSIHDSVAAADVAVGIYSTALLDAWVAGRKVIRLKSKAETFWIPEPPYTGSRNFITFDEDTVLGDFLEHKFCFDSKESRLLNRISLQPVLVQGLVESRVLPENGCPLELSRLADTPPKS
jgi:hypothetical protein